jgi:hypothetical protein
MVIPNRGRARCPQRAAAKTKSGKDAFHRVPLFPKAFEGHRETHPSFPLFRIFRGSISRQSGGLSIELIVATAILLGSLLPFAYSIASEKRFARATYQHSVAMEIVDGEMEALLAGEWRAFTPGVHEYHVRAGAATNLPPGHFLLTLKPGQVRLQWQPTAKPHAAGVIREAKLK